MVISLFSSIQLIPFSANTKLERVKTNKKTKNTFFLRREAVSISYTS